MHAGLVMTLGASSGASGTVRRMNNSATRARGGGRRGHRIQRSKQAIRACIVIVRTVPLNLRRAFESYANKTSAVQGRPPAPARLQHCTHGTRRDRSISWMAISVFCPCPFCTTVHPCAAPILSPVQEPGLERQLLIACQL